MKNFIFFNIIENIGKCSYLFYEALLKILQGKIRIKETLKQIQFLGIDSLPLVTIISIFTGMVLSLQTAYQLKKFGAQIYVGGILGMALARELGPVITAIIVAGRVGSGIAAEISSMKTTEQIDALCVFGIDPVEFLVVPRLIACCLMLPVLTIYADFIGFISGTIIAVKKVNVDLNLFLSATKYIVKYSDILTGLVKAFFFGGIIASIGCFIGFSSQKGAEGVGLATRMSVQVSSIFILIFDYILTSIFYIS